jgi:16S rRNA (guanine527-N7)-methyltransferase
VDRHRDPLPTRVDGLPNLPPGYDRVLDAGLAALQLRPDARARTALADHARLLLAWNAAINLTAITDPERVALLHVVDSLTAVPVLAARPGALRLADLGSGGGYPGLPVAIALPRARAVLVDSVAKKTRFLDTAVAVTGLGDRVAVERARAEELGQRIRGGRAAPFEVVTARAIGSLKRLAELTFPLLAPGGWLVAWKRGDIAAELDDLRATLPRLGGGTVRVDAVHVPGLEGHRLAIVEKR